MTTKNPSTPQRIRQLTARREIVELYQVKKASQGTKQKRKKSQNKKKSINDLIFKCFCLSCYLSFLVMTALGATALSGYLSYLVFWG